MGLVEGLREAVQAERQRVSAELRDALGRSQYTLGQVAMFAEVSEQTVRNLLAGTHFPQLDTLLRIALILGARITFDRGELRTDESEGEGDPLPTIRIEAVDQARSENSSISRSRSTSFSGRSQVANIAGRKPKKATQTRADQQGKTSRKRRETRRYNEDAVYLQNYKLVVGQ